MDEITHPWWDNSQTMQKGYRSYMGWNCIETLTGTRDKVQIDKKPGRYNLGKCFIQT